MIPNGHASINQVIGNKKMVKQSHTLYCGHSSQIEVRDLPVMQ